MWIWRRGWGRALSEEGTGARGGRSTQSAEERRRQVGGKESCGDRLRLEKREKAEAQVPGDRGARKGAEGSGGQSVWAWALGSPAGWGGEGRDDRLCLRPGGRLGSTQGWQSRSCSGSWNSLAQLPGSVCFHLALGSQTT